jgi:hypothetical protein
MLYGLGTDGAMGAGGVPASYAPPRGIGKLSGIGLENAPWFILGGTGG